MATDGPAVDPSATPGPYPYPSPQVPGPRGRRLPPALRGLLSVGLVIGLGLAAAHLAGPGDTDTPAAAEQIRSFPTPGVEAADAPLGTPLPAPPAGGEYAFVGVQADGVTPVGYDPCRPVHYVIRPDNAPAGGEQLVRDAVARVSAVTGLEFVYDGPTDEAPAERRSLFQPDRYGDRWAPVLVSWQTEAENPDFLTDTVGEAGSATVTIAGRPKVFVTGMVGLDAAAFAEYLADPDDVPLARAVVLHELGHLVGLDHVSDPGQLMYPETRDAVDFAPGDLTGLARLGAGECVPEL